MGEQKHGTAIEWTHGEGFKGETWNPVTGCSKVSPGCAHCYAEAVTERYAGRPGWIREHRPWTPANAEHNVRIRPERLEQPLRWRKPRMIFVNSMSDLFHEEVPSLFIRDVFHTMEAAEHHVFQVLTKRPERMRDEVAAYYRWAGISGPLPNVWLGVSIENRRFVGRADLLRETPAAVRFISAEPLLGPLVRPCEFCDGQGWTAEESIGVGLGCCGHYTRWGECCGEPVPVPEPTLEQVACQRCYQGTRGLELLDRVDWLIVGGESGSRHRPIRPEWVTALRDAAAFAGTAFFFKQWGGRTPKSGGRLLDGRTWDEMPAVEVPAAL